MTKAKSKTKNAPRSGAGKSRSSKPHAGAVASSRKTTARPDTKQARIIAMLRAPAGSTVAAIVAATEWQPHSVRGFLAGIVRKKLGLNLVSEQTDKGRIYRIKTGNASSVAAERAKQAS
jgi:hypothetical protein